MGLKKEMKLLLLSRNIRLKEIKLVFLDALASLETTQVGQSVSESVSRNFAKVTMQPS